jgi:hypothetical protein
MNNNNSNNNNNKNSNNSNNNNNKKDGSGSSLPLHMDTTKESVEYNVAACDRLNPREDDMTQGLNMSTSDGMTPNHLQLRNEILIHLEAAKKSTF